MDNGLFSSKSKKIWWSKLKSSFSSKKGIYSKRRDGDDVNNLCEKLNVNEEYTGVLRTQSYIEICNKVQVQLTESPKPTLLHKHSFSSSLSSSPSLSSSLSSLSSLSSSSSGLSTSATLPFYNHLSDLLLEPRQEAIIEIIKSSKLQTLLIGYFDASLEAYNMCESLMKGLHKTRSNHRRIKRVIKLSQEIEKVENEGHLDDFNMEQCHELVLQELYSYASLSNPLSHTINNNALDFPMFHDKYTLLLRKLTSRRRKIKRKEKFKWFYKKVAKYGLLITYIVLVITLVTLAVHSMVGLLGTPGLLLPFSIGLIKKLRDGNGSGSLNVNFLKHLGSQLDVAAKGIYIFINDFDTVGRLVTRLHDEVQHKREIAAMCVKNWKSHDVVREALREFQNHEQGFDEQLQELEEHIYLCLLTINRSRRLVLEEILAPLNKA